MLLTGSAILAHFLSYNISWHPEYVSWLLFIEINLQFQNSTLIVSCYYLLKFNSQQIFFDLIFTNYLENRTNYVIALKMAAIQKIKTFSVFKHGGHCVVLTMQFSEINIAYEIRYFFVSFSDGIYIIL